jgi:plasmid maintenance system antidote protein VapI
MGGLEKFKNYEGGIDVEQETFRNIITGKIYQLLSRENINKKQLADKLNISKAAVTSMLSGDRNFTVDNLIKITSAIGYTPFILFRKKNKIYNCTGWVSWKMEYEKVDISMTMMTDSKSSITYERKKENFAYSNLFPESYYNE